MPLFDGLERMSRKKHSPRLICSGLWMYGGQSIFSRIASRYYLSILAMLVAEAPYDACHYIGQAAPASLLFQFARHDDFVPVQEAERYFALASEPKRIAWYEDCKHELSAQARIDRAIFLCEQLGLPNPSQRVLDLLERVPLPMPIGY
jgi:hypothetical protein